MHSTRNAALLCLALAALASLAAAKHASSAPLLLAAAVVGSPTLRSTIASTADTGASEENPRIGGKPAIHLLRKPTSNGAEPEFLSATILPGHGMNLFQITANVPGKGEVQVFASPSLKEAAQILNGEPESSRGVLSFSMGGAFLVPWANRIRGQLSPDGRFLTTEWHGKTLRLPAVWKGKANPNAERHAIHGLILNRKTDNLKIEANADGETATGILHAGDFGGYWPSKTDVTIAVSLKGKAVEATITAKNIGTEDEPMGIGWHPYFAFPSGDRKQARLHIPGAELAEVNNYDDVFPTGELIPVKSTKYDFTAPHGAPLNDIFLDDNFSQLTRSNGQVVVDVIDPAASYGLHIQGLSNEIKTIQVYAPPAKPYAAIEEQFNFADPFSPVWKKMDTGMVTLEPGEAITWKVRLELFTPQNE